MIGVQQDLFCVREKSEFERNLSDKFVLRKIQDHQIGETAQIRRNLARDLIAGHGQLGQGFEETEIARDLTGQIVIAQTQALQLDQLGQFGRQPAHEKVSAEF